MQNQVQIQPQYHNLTIAKDKQSPYNIQQPNNQTLGQNQIDQYVSINSSETNNSYPMFIPIINNNLQAPMIEQQNQLKNLPFPQQKSIFLQMLTLLIIASTIEFLLTFGLFIASFKFIDRVAPIVFPISLIALLATIKLGSMRKYSKYFHPFLVYILTIYLIPQTFLSFSRLFNHNGNHFQDFADIIFAEFQILIAFNGFSTLLIIVYLVYVKSQISIIPITSLLSGLSIILIIILWPIFPDCIATILFGTLLVNCLQQIQSGRFQLNDQDLMFNTNALFYGILVPFQ